MTNTELRTRTRNYVRGLARRRNSGTFTADDAHRFFDRNEVTDTRTRVSIFNSIVATDEVEPVGTTTSSRPSRRGGTIREWAFTS